MQESRVCLSRRQLVVGAARVAASAGVASAVPASAHGAEGFVHGSGEATSPVAGAQADTRRLDFGQFIHVFIPGPAGDLLPFTGTPLMGFDVEPSTITDFRGDPGQLLPDKRWRATAELEVRNLCLIDSFTFLGTTTTPAVIDAFVRWEATGPARSRGSGDQVPPTGPAAFRGRLRFARAEGQFSGTELGFAFEARGTSRRPAFAELGTERNGVFLG
jgi:hypothetical protein